MKQNGKGGSKKLTLNKKTISILKQNEEQLLHGGVTGQKLSKYSTECDKTCCPQSVVSAESCQTSSL